MNQAHHEQGYIALISAVIIAGILLIVTFSMSYNGFTARANLVDNLHKEMSYQLAEACAHHAILKLLEDNNYTGGETLAFDGETCTVLSPQVSGSQYTIRASAIVGTAHTNIRTVITLPGASIISWEELTNF